MEIKTWRDPYCIGVSMTIPTKIELKSGLTVLVGCNGTGKTTLLQNIEEECKSNKIPVYLWDNLSSGGHNSLSELFFYEEFDKGAFLMSSSEGEGIKFNIIRKAKLFDTFLKEGLIKDRQNALLKVFGGKEEDFSKENKRVLLFDAVDSGLSVDSVVELCELFDLLNKKAEEFGVELYIIIAANEYELARNNQCFDVVKGKYLTFKDYEDYREFILKSREKKNKRIDRQIEWQKKQDEKARIAKEKRIVKYQPKIDALKEIEKTRKLTWSERDKIREYERLIENPDY